MMVRKTSRDVRVGVLGVRVGPVHVDVDNVEVGLGYGRRIQLPNKKLVMFMSQDVTRQSTRVTRT
jgi:hypothetical protein